MNKDLSDFIRSLEPAKDFVVAEAPKVVHEIILSGKVSYGFGMVITGIILILLGILLKISIKVFNKSEDIDSDGWCIGTGIFSIIGITLNLAVFLCNLYGFIHICVAPRLYILEQLKSLVS